MKKALIRFRTGTGMCLLLTGLLLAGCGNMSGLGGSEHYGCKAPSGVQCQSISGAYFSDTGRQARLPTAGGKVRLFNSAPMTKASLVAGGRSMAGQLELGNGAFVPTPLRSPARVLRVWIKPWEDADHDLVDQSYVYVRIDHGKWMLDHIQQQAREGFAPLRPPQKEQQVEAVSTSQPGMGPYLPSMGSPQADGARAQGLEAVARGDAIGGR
jgi:conjugal transfer pilus assembly protein TraV